MSTLPGIGNPAGGGAYGAGKAGAPFDPLAFIKKPQVILRSVSLLFSIIVFGTISAEGYYNDQCQMNNSNACGYGVGIGVLAFLASIVFLVLDAMFDNISSVQYRKYVVWADLGFSGVWAFLYFVGFCYLTDQWRKASSLYLAPDGRGFNDVQAAIAFSFFSIITFAGLTYLAVRRYQLGAQDAFAGGYGDTDPNASSPYSSFPGSETGEPYQQPPFSAQKEVPDYNQPTY